MVLDMLIVIAMTLSSLLLIEYLTYKLYYSKTEYKTLRNSINTLKAKIAKENEYELKRTVVDKKIKIM